MDETTKLLAEIKEELARKDETYALIADSKPDKACACKACTKARLRTRKANLALIRKHFVS